MEGKDEDYSIIKDTTLYGEVNMQSLFWNDIEDFGEKVLLKMKIIKIRVYTGLYKEKNAIIGINITFKNVTTGEIKETITHRGSNDFIDMKEFVIGNGEYLTDFHIRFPFGDLDYVSQLGYSTKKRHFFVPENAEDGDDIHTPLNQGNNIIVGTFGCFNEKLDSIGCLYASKADYTISILFRFLMLRYKIKIDAKFKEEWEKNYKSLPIEYQYIWRFINLSEEYLKNIIKYILF